MDVYLPTRIRSDVYFQGGCLWIWADEEIETLRTLGDAVEIGQNRKPCHIAQHHVSTVEDALKIIDAYRKFAEAIGFSCVFRGQTRDYYDRSGGLLVLPAIMRSVDRYIDFRHSGKDYWDAVRAWLRVLQELGISTGSGLEFDWSSPISNERRLPGKIRVNAPAAIMRRNPVVAAILQHYGFPTDYLDVTTDPIIALWFALHRGVIDDKGRISFRALRARRERKRQAPLHPRQTAEVPTLQIFIQPPVARDDGFTDYPLVDLSKHQELSAVAKRPTRQSACALPCTGFTVSAPPSRRMQFPVWAATETLRWPAAIIKLYFPFDALGRSDLTSRELFPPDEPLYERLLREQAPHLAIYA